MKKKISALILVALLTISFTACGGKTDQGTDFESTGSVASDKQVSDNESDTSESTDIAGEHSADISSGSESTSADNIETSSLSSGSPGNSTLTYSKTNEPNGTSNTSVLASEPNNPSKSEG